MVDATGAKGVDTINADLVVAMGPLEKGDPALVSPVPFATK